MSGNREKIVYVDGFHIRNVFDDMDFNVLHGPGLTFHAPWFIPEGEIWIEKRLEDETKFLLQAEKLEKSLYEKIGRYWPARWRTAKILCRPAKKNYVRKIFRQDGLIIKLVDGGLVRRTLDPAFVMGGHGFVYSSYVPKGEIWLDTKLDPKELKYILAHEEREYRLMEKGWNYNEAHEEASRVERKARIKDGAAFYLLKNPLESLPFVRIKSGAKKRIIFISGIHGDEPSGPYALARFLRDPQNVDFIGRKAQLDVAPLLNPDGFSRRKRGDKNGRDLNRCFSDKPWRNEPPECAAVRKFIDAQKNSYDLLVSFHEDIERRSFYLYDIGNGRESPVIKKIFRTVQKNGVGLYSGIDDNELKHQIKKGYFETAGRDLLFPGFEEFAVRNKKAKKALTLEIPGRLGLEKKMKLTDSIIRSVL